MSLSRQDLFEDISLAIASDAIDIVEQLLSSGDISVNMSDRRGHTPLCIACVYGRYEIAKLLIERGADPSYVIPSVAITALHIASSNGFPDIVKLLMNEGADTGARDQSGSTPLDYAEVSPQLLNLNEVSHERRDVGDDKLIRMRQECVHLLAK